MPARRDRCRRAVHPSVRSRPQLATVSSMLVVLASLGAWINDQYGNTLREDQQSEHDGAEQPEHRHESAPRQDIAGLALWRSFTGPAPAAPCEQPDAGRGQEE